MAIVEDECVSRNILFGFHPKINKTTCVMIPGCH